MMPTIILSLSRNMRRIVWGNIILLTLIVFFILFLFAAQDAKEGVFMCSIGVLLGAGNHLYLNVFRLRKVSRELVSSMETLRSELLLDDLTGVYNRRTGLERLEEEFIRAKREGSSLAVAMMDIDNFKRVNDTYGHLAGDSALREIAQTIRRELRGTDTVVRFGGEEFLVLMPDTDEEEAVYPLDRLRRRLAHTDLACGDVRIKVSISIGLASARPNAEKIMDLLNRADQALIRAKLSGRDKVVVQDQSPLFKLISLN